MTLIYDKVTVIGMGLIGASIALSIRRGGLAGWVVGCLLYTSDAADEEDV